MWGVQADTFTAQLEELRHLELELGHLPQKWNVHWDKLELPPPEQLTVGVFFYTYVYLSALSEQFKMRYKEKTLERINLK